MNAEVNNDNNIFMYTLAGVVLLIVALGLVATDFANAGVVGLTYSIAGIMGISSLSLLTKAIKNDRARLR